MAIHHSEFERIRAVVARADVEGPLTAREILSLVEAQNVDAFDSAHEIATILGRQAEDGGVEIIRDRPYRYRFDDRGR